MAIQVPRVVDVTGRVPSDQKRLDEEWLRIRKFNLDRSKRYKFGTKEGKSDWRERVSKSRSF